MGNQIITGPEFIDKLRYDHFIGGANFDEIADLEGVQAEVVYSSVERESRRQQMVTQFRLAELRRQGAIANERFRQRIRERYSDKAAAAIRKLRNGR